MNLSLNKFSQFFKIIRSRVEDTYYQSIFKYITNKNTFSHSSLGRILFWVPGGMPLMLHVEGAIALALRLRGYSVHMIICDGCYRACIRREVTDGIPISEWNKSCLNCKDQTEKVLKKFHIPYSFIGDYISDKTRSELWDKTDGVNLNNLETFELDSYNPEKNSLSAIFRYLKGHPINGHDDIIREYVYSGLICAKAAENCFDIINPNHIFMSHGIYVDWGPALSIAFNRRIPITTWMASYLPACFYFKKIESIQNIDSHRISSKAWSKFREVNLSIAQQQKITDYLDTRYKTNVSFDMKKFHDYSGLELNLRSKFNKNGLKPVWGIFTHINWDGVSDCSPMAYPSFNDWIIATIREIILITDVQWLIKIHPGEGWENPNSGIQRLIENEFSTLPEHITIISFDETINPLDFYQIIDGGVTVYGTPGLELALLGKPVILAGEAHYGGKGFTYDGLTSEEYVRLLHQVRSIVPLNGKQQALAERYAYCYFIQRQIPMPVVKNPDSTWWKFQYDKGYLLLPGKEPFMDFICDKIMSGDDFIMNEELVKLAEESSNELFRIN